MFSIFARLKCMKCSNWNSTYACPPHTPPPSHARDILSSYNMHLLIIFKIPLKHYYIKMSKLHKKSPHNFYYVLYRIADIKKYKLSRFFYELKNKLNATVLGSEYKYLILAPVSGCKVCKETCALNAKLKCRHPHIRLSSPEAWGISIYDTLRQLSIAFEEIPRNYAIAVGLVSLKIPHTYIDDVFNILIKHNCTTVDNNIKRNSDSHKKMNVPQLITVIDNIIHRYQNALPRRGHVHEIRYIGNILKEKQANECLQCPLKNTFVCRRFFTFDDVKKELLDKGCVLLTVKFNSEKEAIKYCGSWEDALTRLFGWKIVPLHNFHCKICKFPEKYCNDEGCKYNMMKNLHRKNRKLGYKKLYFCSNYLFVDLPYDYGEYMHYLVIPSLPLGDLLHYKVVDPLLCNSDCY